MIRVIFVLVLILIYVVFGVFPLKKRAAGLFEDWEVELKGVKVNGDDEEPENGNLKGLR